MRFTCVFKGGCNTILRERRNLKIHLQNVHKVKDHKELSEYHEIIRSHEPFFVDALEPGKKEIKFAKAQSEMNKT